MAQRVDRKNTHKKTPLRNNPERREGKRSLSSIAETIAAINGTIVAGLERNFAGSSTLSTDCIIHLTVSAVAAGVLLPGITAGLAALRLIGETLLSEEFLLLRGENEFLTAVFANDCFVLIHEIPLLN